MNWDTALAWLREMVFRDNQKLLGIWRAQQGPGPWSIWVLEDTRMLELWAAPGGVLFGKATPYERPKP